ncbi:MAG TPA: hypothetical protein IAC94_03680 [Candidatus Coprenecus avistercoris]|uniref:histidine kinase n=1 Tax=Candidatus Coprenecus avistercoris TaxID=2840730 RepID=A0A9D1E0N9_9BACT|nr:hypothetical protein [Candidatus Coprenecus avistercoris]
MLKEIIHRKELLSRLEEFVYMAEKGNPLDDSFPPFPESRYGRLLNRLVNTYRRDMNDRDTLSVAREMVARESQDNIRQKKQLTQNISHELKTPVSSINGYLETLVNNPNMSPQQRDIFLRKCYEQSQRLSSLLLDLSTITRMDEAGDKIEKERISLSDVVAEAVSDMEPIAGKFDGKDSPMAKIGPEDRGTMQIINDFPEGKEIQGNHSLLYSIFRNLLENAIFYSKGTKVTVRLLEENDREYRISIQDDGVGIESMHLPRIFERFYRIDKGRSRKIGGTGLGLSIVRNAVCLHGGTIKAVPVTPSGLCFEFTLAKES